MNDLKQMMKHYAEIFFTIEDRETFAPDMSDKAWLEFLEINEENIASAMDQAGVDAIKDCLEGY